MKYVTLFSNYDSSGFETIESQKIYSYNHIRISEIRNVDFRIQHISKVSLVMNNIYVRFETLSNGKYPNFFDNFIMCVV